jgi:hypothetical protein
MIEESVPTAAASDAEDDDELLAEAREALADARDALLVERTARADARDLAADAREARLRDSLEQGAQRLQELVTGAAARDRSAEVRERAAEAREVAAELRAQHGGGSSEADAHDRAQAQIDRVWAGQDRDAAAADRAELRDLGSADHD